MKTGIDLVKRNMMNPKICAFKENVTSVRLQMKSGATSKVMKTIILAVVMVIAEALVANTATVNGVTWTYDVLSSGRASIRQFNNSSGWSAAISTSTTGAITIPSAIDDHPVTEIGTCAFRDCSGLAEVRIPNSVTSIGPEAFLGCRGLTNMIIPSSVTSIGYRAFRDCNRLAKVMIPDSVTSIGMQAFIGCSDLLFNRTTIPGVILVDGWAIGHVDSLSGTLDLTGIRGIGDDAFCGCGLTRVVIPDGVSAIGSWAFAGCENLENVRIPSSIVSMGEGVFGNYDAPVVPFLRKLEAAKVVVAARMLSGDLQLEKTDTRYDLSSAQKDRAIASVTVNDDTDLDNFVLTDGKVYDSVLYINNVANRTITLRLPPGNIYKAFKSASPLVVPAQSQCILTITRIAESVFLVSREDLETIQ